MWTMQMIVWAIKDILLVLGVLQLIVLFCPMKWLDRVIKKIEG